MSSLGGAASAAALWRTGLTMVMLAVLAKGLAFLREPIIASALGTSSSSDGYYLAIGIPFFLYNLFGLPFSLWVTARLSAATSRGAGGEAGPFYRKALLWGGVVSAFVALGLALMSQEMIRFYASGLHGSRLEEAASLTRLGALALPALVLQGVCGGRLFAEDRFTTVYLWLAVGGVVGLVGVLLLIPTLGAAGGVFAFAASWWTTALALLALSLRRPIGSAAGVVPWAEDLGQGVVYRAMTMQAFFQGSGLLVYTFASRLAPGEIAAALFGSKITMAIYETIVLTAGAFVFPQIARLLQERDERSVGHAVMEALNWLVPVTVAFMVLVAVSHRDLVNLVYHRRAFDERAVELVSSALFGYAPFVVGMTLVEILHRALVLRGRMIGYVAVFGAALLVNWAACLALVPSFGVMGVAFGSSIGVLFAGGGLWLYAHRRLPNWETQPIVLLVTRSAAAAAIALGAILPLRSRVAPADSFPSELLSFVSGALAVGTIFAGIMHVLGHRWRSLRLPGDQGAAT